MCRPTSLTYMRQVVKMGQILTTLLGSLWVSSRMNKVLSKTMIIICSLYFVFFIRIIKFTSSKNDQINVVEKRVRSGIVTE